MVLTADDLAAMEADIVAIINEDVQQLVLYRGNQTLPAQPFRIVGRGTGGAAQQVNSPAAEQIRGRHTVIGLKSADIQAKDVFQDRNGYDYEIVSVHHDRRVCVQAEARLKG